MTSRATTTICPATSSSPAAGAQPARSKPPPSPRLAGNRDLLQVRQTLAQEPTAQPSAPRAGNLLRDRRRSEPLHRPDRDSNLAPATAGQRPVGQAQAVAAAAQSHRRSHRLRRRAHPRLPFRRHARADQLARPAGGNPKRGPSLPHPARAVRTDHAADVRDWTGPLLQHRRTFGRSADLGRRFALGTVAAARARRRRSERCRRREKAAHRVRFGGRRRRVAHRRRRDRGPAGGLRLRPGH